MGVRPFCGEDGIDEMIRRWFVVDQNIELTKEIESMIKNTEIDRYFDMRKEQGMLSNVIGIFKKMKHKTIHQ